LVYSGVVHQRPEPPRIGQTFNRVPGVIPNSLRIFAGMTAAFFGHAIIMMDLLNYLNV